jgi:hypothetical protein
MAARGPPRIRLKPLFISRSDSGTSDSRPINTPWQPLRRIRSSASSSNATLIADWLTQRIRSGIRARISSLASSSDDVRLSSMKNTSSRPVQVRRTSSTTRSTDRWVCVAA